MGQSPDEGPPTRLEHEVATTKVLEKETGKPKQDTQQLQGQMNKEGSMNVRDASYLKSLYSKMVKYSTQYTSAENGSEDKEVNNLRNALDKWISKTENRISKTEEALGDKLEGLDKDQDGIISVKELLEYIEERKHVEGENMSSGAPSSPTKTTEAKE